MTKNVKVGDGHRNVKKKTIKAIIQSIGNSLIVSSLIASVFKDDVSILIMFTLMMTGIVLIFYSSLE
ncbi:hypothetical protein [uncultured Gammaproteobacteria bacterium]|jgi:hypothetical protein|uniref:Uncharacterized protein n=1 Tax=Bathymodiolus thermophilus thioautotrophic gill symbiont TaxID=2360 RepID=A0ABM8MAB0_9GAMM|nr:hypothetical protein [Bathymodiolus thermophilus thioautotrophic gill symbiont]CAC9488995.1 hypothetical protein [uncultured Gammaproteobacteria bacterium]CAB5507711.1 hypothetical protein AZO1586I_1986 [Bathymodiolus thermophilus thioautotrophic gill symbiont]CAC9509712.1 hypothetical protein [uncultured Gammaproteobacteria bacterium]CAC9514987.1 hypothetical protein [uncultured Gammaproteobacteria bacterium]CAC9538005.1 hypothetical protein [uncultured Gammaproteobacteria bacterium]